MTEVEVHMASCSRRQVAHRQYTVVVEVALGKGHAKTALVNVRNAAYDSVTLVYKA